MPGFKSLARATTRARSMRDCPCAGLLGQPGGACPRHEPTIAERGAAAGIGRVRPVGRARPYSSVRSTLEQEGHVTHSSPTIMSAGVTVQVAPQSAHVRSKLLGSSGIDACRCDGWGHASIG